MADHSEAACDMSTNLFVDNTNDFVVTGFAVSIFPRETMKKTRPQKPTDGELSILRALWLRGPSTVRDVMDEMNKTKETGYTTALKMMQIMTDKGLLERDDAERTHVFKPKLAEEETQRQLVTDLLERAFNGSSKKLVLQALSTGKASGKEIAEITRLLDGIERSGR